MLKFGVVGGAGAVVNTVALYVLHRLLRAPLVSASLVAIELAVLHNYVLNDRWTFGRRALSGRQFVKFNVSMIAGLAVNVVTLWLLVRGGMHLVMANVLAIGAGFSVNFLSSTLWVWGRNR
ncbi:GtrA family protein [Streptomyces spinosirectus]